MNSNSFNIINTFNISLIRASEKFKQILYYQIIRFAISKTMLELVFTSSSGFQ